MENTLAGVSEPRTALAVEIALLDVVLGALRQAIPLENEDGVRSLMTEAASDLSRVKRHAEGKHADLLKELTGKAPRLETVTLRAPQGCDDCSVEPGEEHRYPTCPGNVRALARYNGKGA